MQDGNTIPIRSFTRERSVQTVIKSQHVKTRRYNYAISDVISRLRWYKESTLCLINHGTKMRLQESYWTVPGHWNFTIAWNCQIGWTKISQNFHDRVLNLLLVMSWSLGPWLCVDTDTCKRQTYHPYWEFLNETMEMRCEQWKKERTKPLEFQVKL